MIAPAGAARQGGAATRAAGPDRLLAKTRHPIHGELSLEQHCRDTEQAARLLFCGGDRAALNFARFFRLDTEAARGRFHASLRVAALFHDIGKANAHFFGAVTGTRAQAQTIRHEHLSGLVLCLPAVRSWLEQSREIDFDAVVAAVLSHHAKVDVQGDRKWAQPANDAVLATYLGHAEVRAVLSEVGAIVGSLPPELPACPWGDVEPWRDAFRWGTSRANRLAMRLAKSSLDASAREARQILIASKVGLFAADGVASASFRLGLSMDQWIRGALHGAALTSDEIWRDVLDPRAASVARRSGSPFTFQGFQEGAALLGDRALLVAPCGAGKTLAAWRWIAARAAARPIGRAIFLYPTRGTATEGFRDYVGWAPEADAALVHGTSDYELEGLRDNPSEATAGKDFSASETAARLFAFGLWPKRYFSATVDQFLGFMEHQYASLCLVPALADAAVVIDEVHSFDPALFANLLALLANFDVPVLAMTATLPNDRRRQLEATGLACWPREEDAAGLADLEARAKAPRYSIALAAGREEALVVALAAIAAGQRVLWVVNTVARAQALARELRDATRAPVLCYHSRFKLRHRQDAHARTVAAFQGEAESCVIAVTTQVCEMSLDLDADVLLTEVAPATSLVQRFGRANRHGRRGPTFRAQIVVYPPDRALPYDKQDLADAMVFLASLTQGGGADVSQHDLELALTAMPSRGAEPEAMGRLLTSGWYAVPGSLRDTDELSRQCVLDTDVALVLEALAAGRPIDGFLLPVPRKGARDPGEDEHSLPRWIGVAPAASYSEELGFVWKGGATE